MQIDDLPFLFCVIMVITSVVSGDGSKTKEDKHMSSYVVRYKIMVRKNVVYIIDLVGKNVVNYMILLRKNVINYMLQRRVL